MRSGKAGQGRAGPGRAGQGKAGQGRAGQSVRSRAGRPRAEPRASDVAPDETEGRLRKERAFACCIEWRWEAGE
eukprot:1368661-Pleurochrysis_carterae.AAC.1